MKNTLIKQLLTVLGISLFFAQCIKKDSYYHYSSKAIEYSGSTLEYIKAQTGYYDSLVLVLSRVDGLSDSLQNNSTTLFAPSNNSFAIALKNINVSRASAVPVLPAVSWSTIDKNLLDTVICKYIFTSKITSDDLQAFTDGKLYPSIKYGYRMNLQYKRTNASGYVKGGTKSVLLSDPKGSVYTYNWVQTQSVLVDIKTKNGILHLLTTGHDFGFGPLFVKAASRK